MSAADGPVIFTVGHGTRSVHELVTLLSEAGVARLVDVRTAPGSRKHPQFGRDALERALSEEGIDYIWRKELGGWRRARPESRHVALRSAGFRGYADHMGTEEFGRALDWLVAAARTKRTAVMCAESLWWRCHRRMLADALLTCGCAVFHLVGPGRRERHELHPAARVVDGTLVYDRQPSLRNESAAREKDSSGSSTSPSTV